MSPNGQLVPESRVSLTPQQGWKAYTDQADNGVSGHPWPSDQEHATGAGGRTAEVTTQVA